MARFYECSECEHAQLVGVVDNGLSGYADPRVACENCGAAGKFHFAPGFAALLRANAVQVAPPARFAADIAALLRRYEDAE